MSNSNINSQYPKQMISFKEKNEEWRKRNVDWGDKKSWIYDSIVRKSFINKKINYNLINGKLHMDDLKLILNADCINTNNIPDGIQHYPIINSKLNILLGEEFDRKQEFRVMITNPNAITEMQEDKKKELLKKMEEDIMSNPEIQSKEQMDEALKELANYATYTYKDLREIRANTLLNHYYQELKLDIKFNDGFLDALIVGEELYQIMLVSGEPIVIRLNPRKVHILKSGHSNRVEDADIVIIDDYWSPSKILDYFHDELTIEDVEKLESGNPFGSTTNELDQYDERSNFIHKYAVYEDDRIVDDEYVFLGGINSPSSSYYDSQGNIRVLQVFWKSRRSVSKVKRFDEQTGNEYYDIMPETYIPNKELGEEVTKLWINEAWQGIKIGKDIYVNMRPCPVQFNRMSNPSVCHFGIIGSVYNTNEARTFSIVDMAKPFNYLYNAVHDRLNKAIAQNWGKILELDLAKIPAGWAIEKWMHFATTNKIAVVDSFKEGNKGASTGKLSGAMNNNSKGVIDASTGNFIQEQVNLLEFLNREMGKIIGITDERSGDVANNQTVGGVKTSLRQSTYITERYFQIHDDIKKRALEALIEVSKVALKGKKKKFQWILPNATTKLIEIDGDEFSELDYGLVVDNSTKSLELNQKLDQLAQAALQNQALSFSSIMKLYSSMSLAEKQRIIEIEELDRMNQAQQQQQSEQEQVQQQQQIMMEIEQTKIELEKERLALDKYKIDQDNATKLSVEEIRVYQKRDELDANMNGISDPTEIRKVALSEIEAQSNKFLEEQKLRLAALDSKIKLNDTASRERTEKYKADIALQIAKENKTQFELKSRNKK